MKEFIAYDDYNSRIPNDPSIIGSMTTHIGSSTFRTSWKVIEICYELFQNGNSNDD